VGLVLAPDTGGPPGVQALAFAGSVVALGDTRGISIELLASAPAVAAAPGSLAGAERLDHAVVLTSDHDAALRLYGERLGLRLALDRSFPERGVRLLFFRLAGVTIEIGGPIESLEGAASDTQDRFGGLAWRGSDVVAWRERLLAEGFAVSEHRRGHKAGTRVCTVQDRTGGVPTLLIAPDASSPVAGA
jgi:catechol 2,3-dioxygenase-like lactoylglutathione lyase family enzyme